MTCRIDFAAAAVLTASLFLAAPALRADVLAGGHELVVLAEAATPAAPDGSSPMDLTLTWTVREIFAGEPSSVTIAVRHQNLEPAQVRSLATDARWIVLADPDPRRPGRWVASMPLRATPAAIEAFRKWSAPADVRPERDLGSVVAEVQQAEPEVPEPQVRQAATLPTAPELVEASPVLEVEATVAEGPVVEAEDAPVDRDAAPVEQPEAVVTIVDTREWAPAATPVAEAPAEDRWREPAPISERTSEPVEIVRIAEVDIPADHVSMPRAEPVQVVSERRGPLEEPPHTWQPQLQPPTGPGLPPRPPARPLGPPPSRRDDLKKAKPRADDDA